MDDRQLAAVARAVDPDHRQRGHHAAGVPELNKAHPQIKTLVVPGAQHGGPEGVMRRPEFMAALRPFLAGAR